MHRCVHLPFIGYWLRNWDESVALYIMMQRETMEPMGWYNPSSMHWGKFLDSWADKAGITALSLYILFSTLLNSMVCKGDLGTQKAVNFVVGHACCREHEFSKIASWNPTRVYTESFCPRLRILMHNWERITDARIFSVEILLILVEFPSRLKNVRFVLFS